MKKVYDKDKMDSIKAMRKGGREAQMDINGGGQWVSSDRPWKNKSKYNRNDEKNKLRKGVYETRIDRIIKESIDKIINRKR